MIDEKKVSLMTKIALFEKKQGSGTLIMSRYYKSDYVRYNVLKTWVSATVVYWVVIAFYVYMKFDDMLAKVSEVDYFDVMYKLLGWYVLFCFGYFVFSYLLYGYRYDRAREGLAEYNSNLKDLIELEGGPIHRGKLVADSDLNTRSSKRRLHQDDIFAEEEENQEAIRRQNRSQQVAGPRVNKEELLRQRQEREEKLREQQIIENVKQRNARIAAQNEAALRHQQQYERDRQQIIERRKMLEQQRLEQIRKENQKRINRENHQYTVAQNNRGENSASEGRNE
ncbi:MAG: hypothetical protein ACI4D8_00065 [Wujia sp.]